MVTIKLCSEDTIRAIEQFFITNDQRDKVLVAYESAYDTWYCTIPFNVPVILSYNNASHLMSLELNKDAMFLDLDEVKVVIE